MIIKNPPVYDTSHWRTVPDFALVAPRPFLVITKATEGNWYKDPTFIPYFNDLQQDGIHRGAFHFHRNSVSGLLQAQYFCNHIKPYVTSKDLLVLDVEEGGEQASQLQAFLMEVIRQFPVNHANRLVMIYSRKNILDAIVMTEAHKAFFTDIPTWTAGYPSNPDLYSSVPSFYVPDQTKYGSTWLWQYTDRGNVQGISETTDCNWIASELIARLGPQPQPPDPDITTTPHNGMTLVSGVRNGWKFRLLITDRAIMRYELVSTPALETVPSVTARKGATFGCNAGEWNDRDDTLPTYLKPEDYTVSNGVLIMPRTIEAPPSLMIDASNTITVHHIAPPNIRQAFSGLRLLIESGQINPLLSGTAPEYREGHARMIAGYNDENNLMVMLSEGVYPNQGLTLKQCADIMKQYGCVKCADFGGGGDAGGVLDGEDLIKPENIVNGVNVYRRLPMTFLIYANDGGTNMNGTAKEKLGNNSTVRTTPSRYGNSVYTIPAGSTIEFIEYADVIISGTADKAGDKWLKLPDGNFVNYILSGVQYYTVLTEPTTEPPPTNTKAVSVTVTLEGYKPLTLSGEMEAE